MQSSLNKLPYDPYFYDDELNWFFKLDADSNKHRHEDNDKVLVRVLLVCRNAGQDKYFLEGKKQFANRYPELWKMLKFQYLDNDLIRSENKKPKDIVDWLLGGDIHFILSHVHQGILNASY